MGSGTSVVESAIDFASAQVGDPYVYGGNGPNAWDCSGLVQAAYQQAKVALPRVAADQYRATTPLTRSQLQRGDLVFWSTNGRASGVYHVAIYLGGDQYLESPRPGRSVRVSSFSSFNPNLYGRAVVKAVPHSTSGVGSGRAKAVQSSPNGGAGAWLSTGDLLTE